MVVRSLARAAVRFSASSPQGVHVLTACNEYRQETVVLECSARHSGYSFRAVGLGRPWHGLGSKLALYDRALKELVGSEIALTDPVLLLDAWDTVLLGPAEELHEKLYALGIMRPGGWVLGAADRICAPEYRLAVQVERLYPAVRTPWRYPNSGAFAGTGEALRAFMHHLVHSSLGGTFSEDGDDQLRVQTVLLACAAAGSPFPFYLDTDCAVFQCMGEPSCGWDYEPRQPHPRIRNHVTGERPLLAHGCGGHGRWFLADVYRKLQLLSHLGLVESDLAGYRYAGLVPPGQKVTAAHWVEQPPWEFPFQAGLL